MRASGPSQKYAALGSDPRFRRDLRKATGEGPFHTPEQPEGSGRGTTAPSARTGMSCREARGVQRNWPKLGAWSESR